MYPSDINGYLPTSYDCSFECLTGYVLSEGTCVLAPSGIARRQVLRTCPFGQTRCHAYGSDDGWECLGVSSHLESCGGCPGTRSSVDCTGLEGVHGVQCRRGACVVLSCAEAFELVGGECRAKGVLRWPQLQSQT
jgi:hypothetical protein